MVGTLSAVDRNVADSHVYEIVDAAGNVIDDTPFEIAGNRLQVKAGADIDFETASTYTLNVRATDDRGSSYTEALTIDVADVNESPAASAGAVVTTEDTATIVTLLASDIDAGDSIGQIRIDTLPGNGRLLLHGRPVEAGMLIDPADIEAAELQFIPDSNWHGKTTLTFRAFDGELWSSAAEYVIAVDAAADPAVLSVQPAQGFVGQTVPLEISASLRDSDGSETLTIRIDGVPDGAVLNAGHRQADDGWLVPTDRLSRLELTLPTGSADDLRLIVSAITKDANGDVATVTQELNVVVNALEPTTGVPVTAIQAKAIEDQQAEPAVVTTTAAQPQRDQVSAEVSDSTDIDTRDTAAVTPVGDLIVQSRVQTTDWATSRFGEVQPLDAELQPRSADETSEAMSPLLEGVDSDGQGSETELQSAADSGTGVAWFWTAVRAFGGVRDSRKH